MTKLKEQAIALIQEISDDKVIHILNILKGLKGLSETNENKVSPRSEAQAALEGLKQYKGSVPANIDEKAELAEARNEKYARFS